VEPLSQSLKQNAIYLIKDLNGNHVIQKCLQHFSPQHNQFIYDTIVQNCVEVATHRHGCCVIQRCIDRATEAQKVQLVREVILHALTLVQVRVLSKYFIQPTALLKIFSIIESLWKLRDPVHFGFERPKIYRLDYSTIPWKYLSVVHPKV
jgi:hypothetical protein